MWVIKITWTYDFFVKNSDLFLRIMNYRWEQGLEEAKWIVKILEMNDIFEGKILDIMCGNGRHALYLAEKGYDVIGLDISPIFIEDATLKAKKMNLEENVKFLVGDFRQLNNVVRNYAPFDAIINFWTSIGYYGEEADIMLFKNARRVIRDNGLFILADTISKESLLSDFHPFTYVEFPDLLILHFAEYDPLSSKLNDLWRIYEKKDDSWIFRGAVKINLRVYSLGEIVSILRKTGWTLIAAYDSIIGLTPLRHDSKINIVAKATSGHSDY